jgi:hypothetical protein
MSRLFDNKLEMRSAHSCRRIDYARGDLELYGTRVIALHHSSNAVQKFKFPRILCLQRRFPKPFPFILCKFTQLTPSAYGIFSTSKFFTKQILSPHMIIFRVTTGRSFTRFLTPNPLSSNRPSIVSSGKTQILTPSAD